MVKTKINLPIYYMVGTFAAAMSTRSDIISLGDALIREKGFNGFSFYDISKTLGIKNASVHYHFHTKADLGMAVIDAQMEKLAVIMEKCAGMGAMAELEAFLSIYVNIKAEGKICLVGSLASDLPTLEPGMAEGVRVMVEGILNWVSRIIEEGYKNGVFTISTPPRTKALLIITNMLASLQLTRLTGAQDFDTIKNAIIKELQA